MSTLNDAIHDIQRMAESFARLPPEQREKLINQAQNERNQIELERNPRLIDELEHFAGILKTLTEDERLLVLDKIKAYRAEAPSLSINIRL